jgi:hypothetical protein
MDLRGHVAIAVDEWLTAGGLSNDGQYVHAYEPRVCTQSRSHLSTYLGQARPSGTWRSS